MSELDIERSNEIARKNDLFRTTMICGERHRILMTDGVSTRNDVTEIVRKVQKYDDFNRSNDPHGEHDFGGFFHDNTKFFWKIDYYDDDLNGGTDPTDPNVRLVLTIMRADEY